MASLSEQGQELKQNLWAIVDDHNSPLNLEIKETMNNLLDLIDELEEEQGE